MMVFVMIGVFILVFTILYLSPMDPARNILGANATPEKVATFEKMYGLDQPYLVQLWNTGKKFLTFDLGTSYVGNEDIAAAFARRFPITVQLSLAAMLVSVIIAIPSGIISAIKQYSAFDYIFMLIALLGLSIPNFWLGLILILNFSIRLGWLPAMYDAANLATLIMPAIVLGTGLSASVARMTRSSMLEVKNSDYVLTARAKGLSENRVVFKHILGNAMIPIVTVIGLQFGGILGGSAVTEKVFNVNGLGKYIVDKQFIIYNGASSARGALGYVEAAAELLEQISSDSSFSSIQNICVPGGNGGLAAGFIYGTALLGNPFHVELISVEHEREPLRAIILGFLKDLEALCGVPMPCTLEETATLHEQYRFGGWGVIDPAVEEFNLEFARTEGIFVEKVYTGKALYGVCDLAKRGYFPQGACFLHSGGIGALFSQYHTAGGAL